MKSCGRLKKCIKFIQANKNDLYDLLFIEQSFWSMKCGHEFLFNDVKLKRWNIQQSLYSDIFIECGGYNIIWHSIWNQTKGENNTQTHINKTLKWD